MAFKIAGRFIALSQVKEVASSGQGQQPFKKQEIYMDCTRFDGITGQMIGKENKMVLEFGGEKVLDKLKAMNLKKDDVVNVSFDLQGYPTKDSNTGKMKVFTAIRCFDIEIIRRAGQPMQVAAQTPQPQPTPAPEPQPQPATPPIDSVTGETPKDDGLPF